MIVSTELLKVGYEVIHDSDLAIIKYIGVIRPADIERFIPYQYHGRDDRRCFRIVVDIREAKMALSELEIISLLKKLSLRRTINSEQWIVVTDYTETMLIPFLFESFAEDFNINLKICSDNREAAVLMHDQTIDEKIISRMENLAV